PQTSGLPPGRTLSRRASGPTPYALPSDAGQRHPRTGADPTGRDVLLGRRNAPRHRRPSGPGATDSNQASACDATGGPRHPLDRNAEPDEAVHTTTRNLLRSSSTHEPTVPGSVKQCLTRRMYNAPTGGRELSKRERRQGCAGSLHVFIESRMQQST
ncbi:hypothetical protein L9F63_028249, partial [Diploptera punctata]